MQGLLSDIHVLRHYESMCIIGRTHETPNMIRIPLLQGCLTLEEQQILCGIHTFRSYKLHDLFDPDAYGCVPTASTLTMYVRVLLDSLRTTPRRYSDFYECVSKLVNLHNATHQYSHVPETFPYMPPNSKGVTGIALAEHIYYTHTSITTHFCELPSVLRLTNHTRTISAIGFKDMDNAFESIKSYNGDIIRSILQMVANLIVESCKHRISPSQWMADRGCVKAIEHRAEALLKSQCVKKNRKRAAKLVFKGVALGSAKCHRLRYEYLNEDALEVAAKLGDTKAQHDLGTCVWKDNDTRIKYKYRAASQGHNVAIHQLYTYYLHDPNRDGLSFLLWKTVQNGHFEETCRQNSKSNWWNLQQRCFMLAVGCGMISGNDILFGIGYKPDPELQRRSHAVLTSNANLRGRPLMMNDTSHRADVSGIPYYYILRLLRQQYNLYV